MRLVFIYGAPASGKLTVARELGAMTGVPVFHNHLVVDALLERLPFGDPEFVRLREAMWMAGFETAARNGASLIFTFSPEPTVVHGFAERVIDLVEGEGGDVQFVQLTLSADEQEKRIGNDSRRAFKKLVSLELLRELRASFEACERDMPSPSIRIDTGETAPRAAAEMIAAALELATL